MGRAARIACVAALALGCDGEAKRIVPRDAGAPADAGASADASGAAEADGGVACAEPADCAGASCRQGDLDLACLACAGGRCSACGSAADCRVHAAIWNACAEGACVECEGDADCAGNPDALGPRCDAAARRCVCEDDDGCAGNPNGPRCLDGGAKGRYCGCVGGEDCGDLACGVPGWLDVCRPAGDDGGTGTADAGVLDGAGADG